MCGESSWGVTNVPMVFITMIWENASKGFTRIRRQPCLGVIVTWRMMKTEGPAEKGKSGTWRK